MSGPGRTVPEAFRRLVHWINNEPSRLRTLQPWYPGASAHSHRQEDEDQAAVADTGGPTVDRSKLRESLPGGAATEPAELSGRREARALTPCGPDAHRVCWYLGTPVVPF